MGKNPATHGGRGSPQEVDLPSTGTWEESDRKPTGSPGEPAGKPAGSRRPGRKRPGNCRAAAREVKGKSSGSRFTEFNGFVLSWPLDQQRSCALVNLCSWAHHKLRCDENPRLLARYSKRLRACPRTCAISTRSSVTECSNPVILSSRTLRKCVPNLEILRTEAWRYACNLLLPSSRATADPRVFDCDEAPYKPQAETLIVGTKKRLPFPPGSRREVAREARGSRPGTRPGSRRPGSRQRGKSAREVPGEARGPEEAQKLGSHFANHRAESWVHYELESPGP